MGFARLLPRPRAGLPSSSDLARGGAEGPRTMIWWQSELKPVAFGPRSFVRGRVSGSRGRGGVRSKPHLYLVVGCDVRPTTGMHFIPGKLPRDTGKLQMCRSGGPCSDGGNTPRVPWTQTHHPCWTEVFQGKPSKCKNAHCVCGLQNHLPPAQEKPLPSHSVIAPTGNHEHLLKGLGTKLLCSG